MILTNIGKVIDILMLLVTVFWLFKISTWNFFKGTILVILISGIAFLLHSTILPSLIYHYGIFTLIVIFHSDIRQGIEKLGHSTNILSKLFRKNSSAQQTNETISAIVEAADDLSSKKIGALIVIDQEDIDTIKENSISNGVPIHADVSRQLLENLFFPNSPLHDGAVVIKDNEIKTAGSVLPLADNETLPKDAGTRHRAALGVSEIADNSIAIVVSEETGNISIVINGEFHATDISKSELENFLNYKLS